MKCRLCNDTNLSIYYRQGNKDQFIFYKCNNCKLVNLDLANLNHINNQKKYATEYIDPFDTKKNKGTINTYCFIKKNNLPKGKFLDIGCGNGSLLHYAHKDGWEVKGLELSEKLAEQVNSVLNIKVDVKNFQEIENFQEKFDLISLRHVLEHLPDSISAMNNISKLLNDDGYALLEFPNINSISFKTKLFMTKLNLYKKKYPVDYRPGHCNEFSRESFSYLIDKCNFRLVKWESYSTKAIFNFLYNHIHHGTKVRALIQKITI
ncbi:MAG: class I SAM-dependent methyltransferase [Proteobacteria bacterium]|nr:class I SAM-dependent methyltransferase [Pseudomonadota bacterium]MBU1687259.1 class I SAM-dependent methyltransferase [Pseudomonadota bacterium]